MLDPKKGKIDMTPANHKTAVPTVGDAAAEKMAEYGITRVAVDYFHYKDYRYTNLDDAIAQAHREHPGVPSDGRERSGLR
jgi:hypothetical protein